MGKRGQITVFILIGLVVLIIFGFIYYMYNLQARTQERATTEKQITDA